MYGGNHRIHIASGVAPKVNHDARDILRNGRQHGRSIFDALFAVPGEMRQSDHRNTAFQETDIGSRPLGRGVRNHASGKLKEGMFTSGHLGRGAYNLLRFFQ